MWSGCGKWDVISSVDEMWSHWLVRCDQVGKRNAQFQNRDPVDWRNVIRLARWNKNCDQVSKMRCDRKTLVKRKRKIARTFKTQKLEITQAHNCNRRAFTKRASEQWRFQLWECENVNWKLVNVEIFQTRLKIALMREARKPQWIDFFVNVSSVMKTLKLLHLTKTFLKTFWR